MRMWMSLALSAGLCVSPSLCVSAAEKPAATMVQPASTAEVAAYAQQVLADNVAADGPGVAILVARGDQVLFRGARGLADVELGVPLTPDQVFRIGSVTKQFAAAGVLKLVEAGKVGLDDPVSKYLKDYPNGGAISVRQLLNHTSGVKSYTGIDGYMTESIKRDLSTEALIDVFKDLPADFAPGQGYAYNNSGYVLVGAVIEAASGKPWHAYLDETLFKPLGLAQTRYGDVHALIPGYVNGYTRIDGRVAPMGYLDMSQPHAAGALVSTLDDLLRWNLALHEGKVLKPANYRAMTSPEGKAAASGYGYGIERASVRGRIGRAHGGGIFGFASYLLYLPDSKTTVALLTNSDTGVPGGPSLGGLSRKLAAMALGDAYPAVVAVPVDAAALRQAEGVYRQNPHSAWVLRAVDGGLTVQRIGGQRLPLTAVARDTFAYPDGIARMSLERDARGAVTGMRFFADGIGESEFTARSGEAMP
ncbi:serine hydrolase domain-containing protein [Lysobacter capsici]|uniref:serine hydrolase domain-containing protein n=1 Tax=Lysobacter capsici TaxID=435897 RepID=UPI001C00289E|nr:serine hydrolase domain-containing protein [Lysobacter capsici]QWF17336.1 beta-lactamase family protein [Lysobacter capsici]